MKLYDLFSGEELKIAEKIQQRRLQMLVNSYLYYKTEKAVVSDADWDKWAKELVQLQEDYPDIAEQVPYATEFANWDGTTGEFLPLSEIKDKALWLQSTMGQQRKVNNPVVILPQSSKPNQAKKKNILQRKLF